MLLINNFEDDGVCRGPVYSMSCLLGSARPAIDFPTRTGSSAAPAFGFFQRELLCARQVRPGGHHAPQGWDSLGESHLLLHPSTGEGFSYAGLHCCLVPCPATTSNLWRG